MTYLNDISLAIGLLGTAIASLWSIFRVWHSLEKRLTEVEASMAAVRSEYHQTIENQGKIFETKMESLTREVALLREDLGGKMSTLFELVNKHFMGE